MFGSTLCSTLRVWGVIFVLWAGAVVANRVLGDIRVVRCAACVLVDEEVELGRWSVFATLVVVSKMLGVLSSVNRSGVRMRLFVGVGCKGG